MSLGCWFATTFGPDPGSSLHTYGPHLVVQNLDGDTLLSYGFQIRDEKLRRIHKIRSPLNLPANASDGSKSVHSRASIDEPQSSYL